MALDERSTELVDRAPGRDETAPVARRWRSTFGAALLVVGATLTTAMGFVVVPGAAKFDVPTSQFLVWYSIFTVAGAVSTSVVGRVIARVGVRTTVIVSSIVAVVAACLMAMAPSISLFYGAALLLGIGWGGCTMLPASVIVTGWWRGHPKAGTVMGFVMMSVGFGGLVWGVLMPAAIAAGGFEGAMFTVAGLIVVAMTLPGILLIRNPSPIETPDKGEGGDAEKPLRSPAASRVRPGSGRRVAAVVLVAFAISLTSPVSQILPAILDSKEISPVVAGYLISYWSLAIIAIKPTMGWLHDRFGLVSALSMVAAGFTIGFVGLAFSAGMIPIMAALPVMAVATASTTILMPMVVAAFFGSERFAQIYGLVTMALFLGQAIGAPAWGLSYDLSGNYAPALLAGSVVGAGSVTTLMVLARSRRAHRIRGDA